MPRNFQLNTGASIPAIGFGTWQDESEQENAIVEAIQAGYRHIDTARIYGTEKAVGNAIKRAGVPREDLFVTTKLWNNKHHPEDVEPALQESLDDLGLDYVDLYLMHWPVAWKRGDDPFPKDSSGYAAVEDIDYIDTYEAMEKLFKAGKVKAIGVSNFSRFEIEQLVMKTSVTPAVHQMECHPWLQQREFTAWHRLKGIHVTHYSPFGNQNSIYHGKGEAGKLLDERVLAEIGKQYNRTPAQIALAWGITQGHSVLPKSKTPERIRSNLSADLELSPDDMRRIEDINRKIRFNDSSGVFGRTFFEGLEGKRLVTRTS